MVTVETLQQLFDQAMSTREFQKKKKNAFDTPVFTKGKFIR